MKISTGRTATYESTFVKRTDGRTEYQVSLKANEEGFEKAYLNLEWTFPILDIAGRWHPVCGKNRSLVADWSYGSKSMTACSAPVMNFFSEDDKNRYTVAISETKKEVVMSMGVHEEDGTMKCVVKIDAGDMLPNEEYKVRVLIDERAIPYYQSLHEVQTWWAEECNMIPTEVPRLAKEAMYSFWYSFHQEFTDEEIEEECRRAKELGFETIILDDGWQTDDTNRGYGFCGDWEVAESKIKNMQSHVEKVHKIGLKYMIWFSVPYVGPHSKIWDRFKDKLIAYDKEQEAGILDIRYAEVRNYLKNIYINAVKKWKLDGLKLDFIDEFSIRESTPAYNEKMDFRCLQDALDCLLNETMQELKQINPEFLIEFRQRYVGPNIRKYGNIIRVGDCPLSAVSNRVGVVDLRLLSGNTAVHSDMLMWHEDETAEDAAIQVISCLFGTLQFSVNLDKLNDSQKAMIQNYLTFMRDNKELLQDTMIQPKEPVNLYPEVRVANEKEEIIALYSSNRVVTLADELEKSTILNGTKSEKMYLRLTTPKELKIQSMDCKGVVINTSEMNGKGIFEVTCTPGGRVEIA